MLCLDARMDFIKHKTIVGKTYCISANSSAKAVADIGGSKITLVSISQGQGTFIAPCKCVSVTPNAVLTPCFKGAALTAQESGINFLNDEYEADITPNVKLGVSARILLCSEAKQVTIKSAFADNDKNLLASCHFVITPVKELSQGWLTAEEGVSLRWLVGEPLMPPGHTYIVSVLQVTPTEVIANLSAVL